MTQQPEALRLATVLETHTGTLLIYRQQAAAELRRLHEENERLKHTPPEEREDLRCTIADLCRYVRERDARITTLEAALRQAVEALVAAYQGKDKTGQVTEAITAAKQALEGNA